ncbi:formate dehydrogenase subunit gamma [Cupriavidus respiraculi]|uniref:formate dehydrogenase subunit gamma n=1 Tax=Cupriavidus respiraculi TaxID=195930 RepID=UPI001C981AD5|nr:formate dehydrogenase subunit gamma [Cupriavidus respiraculi]MBY4945167.1 formate dehydrogenase subunit gamma [Cupriavidus respiraculi]
METSSRREPPADGGLDGAASAAVAAILAAHRETPGALLPILHDIQDALGHVPAGSVPAIARALNLSRAEVHGVITFYHHFRDKPAGRCVVQLCRAEACQSVGSEALAAHAEAALGCAFGQTTPDGAVSLEAVYCLGQCATGPAAAIDGEPHARLTTARLDALIEAARKRELSDALATCAAEQGATA